MENYHGFENKFWRVSLFHKVWPASKHVEAKARIMSGEEKERFVGKCSGILLKFGSR